MSEILATGAFWGFLGAFAYAGPNFGACLRDHPGKWLACLFDASMAMIIGTIFVAAMDPSIVTHLPDRYAHDARALEFVIGIAANRATPVIIGVVPHLISVLGDRMLDFIAGRAKRDP